MSTVHGGHYDEENERARPAIINDEPVDLREQQALYVQVQHGARLAEVRLDEERRQRVDREERLRVQQMWNDQVRAQQQQRQDEQARLARLRLQQQEQRRAAEAEAERREQQARFERLRRQQWLERRAAEVAAKNERGGWCTIM